MKIGMISLLSGTDEGTFLLKNLSVFEGGRSQGNHVLLKDPSVAMSHFRICRNDSDYVIYDQGAKSGTWVNGQTFEKVTLKGGDIIKAGNVEMRFDLVDADTPGRIASSAPELGGAKSTDKTAPVEPLVTGDPRALVEVVEGDQKGKVFELAGKEEFVIGRSTNADLRLRDGKVSRSHCIISMVGDHFIVTDNQSSNGTVVNGEKIRKTVLKDGDFIRLGFTILRFKVRATVPH